MKRKDVYKYILPVVVLIVLFQVFPFLYNFYLSLHSWYLPTQKIPIFVGLKNYIDAWRDENFLHSIKVQFLFSIISLSVELLIGLGLALLLNREIKGKNIFRTLFILPMMATPVAMNLIWKVMYNPTTGLINQFLLPVYKFFSIEPLTWTGDTSTALLSVIIASVWRWAPFTVFILLAGLQSIDPTLYEAASIDGASTLKRFQHITLPYLKTPIAIALLFRSLDLFKTFDEIYILTGGGPALATEIINIHIFFKAFEGFHMGYASALTMILFLFSMALAGIIVVIIFLRES